MPTLAGMRRRGYTPEAIRNFCERIGVAKRNSIVDIAMLEHCLREDLNKRAPRVMAVLRPIKIVLENYPEGQVEELIAVNNPEDPAMGTRKVPFSRTLYIEKDDFREEPPKGFFRLSPGKEVRLRYGYIIKCIGVDKDPATGEIRELRCTYDPETKSGSSQSGRKVKATIHWVSAAHALEAEVRLYEHLFTKEDPDDVPEGADWLANINPQLARAADRLPRRTRAGAGQSRASATSSSGWDIFAPMRIRSRESWFLIGLQRYGILGRKIRKHGKVETKAVSLASVLLIL